MPPMNTRKVKTEFAVIFKETYSEICRVAGGTFLPPPYLFPCLVFKSHSSQNQKRWISNASGPGPP